MPPRSRTATDTDVRVGPAAGRVVLGKLETDVHAAMTAALLMVSTGATHQTVTIYRKALDRLTVRLPNITRELAAAEIGRFMQGFVTTGEQNTARAAARCTARMVTIDRFTMHKETEQ